MNFNFKNRLILATYQNDYRLVKELVESDEFDEKLINHIGFLDVKFPLYYITMCNRRVMSGNFRDDLKTVVDTHLKNIGLLLEYWKTRFGVDVDEKIDYWKYKSHFYSDDDDSTIEDILLDPVQMYLDNGCRQIDIDLFEAVCKFQYDRVKDLLEKGANPDAELLPAGQDNINYAWNCYDRIGDECSFLCSCEVLPLILSEDNHINCSSKIGYREICDLIGWAAHEEMLDLLDTYVAIKDDGRCQEDDSNA